MECGLLSNYHGPPDMTGDVVPVVVRDARGAQS